MVDPVEPHPGIADHDLHVDAWSEAETLLGDLDEGGVETIALLDCLQDVARELRRRIKRRFDEEGIEIPFPQRTVWQRPAPEA